MFGNRAEHASSLQLWIIKQNLTRDISHDWLRCIKGWLSLCHTLLGPNHPAFHF